MIVLGIDSLSRRQSAAVMRDETILSFVESSFPPEDLLARRTNDLLAVIGDAINRSGVSIEEFGGIAVTVGPGSFTGIRIGLATMLGLAFGRTFSAVGVTSLEAIEDSHHAIINGQPVIQMKRNEWVTRANPGYRLFGAAEWKEVFGNHTPILLGSPPIGWKSPIVFATEGLAGSVARIGSRLLIQCPRRPEEIEPLYLTACYVQ